MKKYIFAIGLVIAALTSCNKVQLSNEVIPEPQKPAGIPMTLTATIGDATKITYTDDSGLKGTWDANETITIVSFDNSNNILAFDNFTSTGAAGRTTAEFSGTLTAESPAKMICYYPAVTYSEALYMDKYHYLSENTEYEGMNKYPLVFENTGSTTYGRSNFQYQNQSENNSTAHIGKRCILFGEANLTSTGPSTYSLNATLTNATTALKLILTIPESIEKVYHLKLTSSSSQFLTGGWFYSYMPEAGICMGGSSLDIPLFLGGWAESSTPAGIDVPVGRVMTFYVLTAGISDSRADYTWTIDIKNALYNNIATKTLTFKDDKSFEHGKVYTITAALDLVTP